MKKALGLTIFLVLLGVASVQSARAQSPVALVAGNSLLYGGTTFTITACHFENASFTRSTACSASKDDFYLAPDPSAPSQSVIVEALSGGITPVPIFSFTCGVSGGCTTGTAYDLSLTLSVTPPGGQTFSSAIQTASFSAPSGLVTSNPADGKATETINSSLCTLTSNLGTATPPSCTFTPQTSLVVQKDLGITVNNLANGSTLALNSVVENFAHVPEPSSVAVLVSGLVLLVRTRRKRSRP